MAPDDRPHVNGARHHCPVGESWEDFREEFEEARKSCKELHGAMELILKNTGYLVKLPELADSVQMLNSVIQEMKDSLLAPAIGRDQVPKEILTLVIEAQNKSARYNSWILGSIIGAFVFIFGFLLTGERFGLISPLQRKILGGAP